MYEDYVNSRIVDAASNLCKKRALVSAPSLVETSFNFSGKALVEFDDLRELQGKLAVNTSFHPINQGFGAVDFITLGVVGNMTLNIRHGISLSKLEKVADFLIAEQADGAAVPMPLEFWWVVPSRKQYEKLKNQSLMLKGRVASAEKQQAFAAKVILRQFVVLMRPDGIGKRKGKDESEEERGDGADDEQMPDTSEEDEDSRSRTRRTSRKSTAAADAATSSSKRSASSKGRNRQ
ncbi:MAG: hypothetical protein Q7T57_04685 [Dehalococcoidales bacterium]|nr:hypothetical protein [Dehalococcoidales bacterium]